MPQSGSLYGDSDDGMRRKREQHTDDRNGLGFAATNCQPNLRGPHKIDCKQKANHCPSQGPLEDRDWAQMSGWYHCRRQ